VKDDVSVNGYDKEKEKEKETGWSVSDVNAYELDTLISSTDMQLSLTLEKGKSQSLVISVNVDNDE
jgi:hypothetical protein